MGNILVKKSNNGEKTKFYQPPLVAKSRSQICVLPTARISVNKIKLQSIQC